MKVITSGRAPDKEGYTPITGDGWWNGVVGENRAHERLGVLIANDGREPEGCFHTPHVPNTYDPEHYVRLCADYPPEVEEALQQAYKAEGIRLRHQRDRFSYPDRPTVTDDYLQINWAMLMNLECQYLGTIMSPDSQKLMKLTAKFNKDQDQYQVGQHPDVWQDDAWIYLKRLLPTTDCTSAVTIGQFSEIWDKVKAAAH